MIYVFRCLDLKTCNVLIISSHYIATHSDSGSKSGTCSLSLEHWDRRVECLSQHECVHVNCLCCGLYSSRPCGWSLFQGLLPGIYRKDKNVPHWSLASCWWIHYDWWLFLVAVQYCADWLSSRYHFFTL